MFKVLPSEVPLERVRFTGSPHFYANGTMWTDPVDPSRPWPENIRWFGPRSPELDGEWVRYIGKRYISISEAEAKRAWGDRYREYVDHTRGGYTAG